MKPTPAQEARAAQTVRDGQITIEDWLASQPVAARGQTCEAEDVPRLSEQCVKVYGFLRDLRPHTLREIEAATGVPQASASARIREIRRYLRVGNKGDLPKERVRGGNGLWIYTLKLNRYPGAA